MTRIPRLFELMNKNSLKAKSLAAQLPISEGNISDWKSGRSMPSADKLIVLADYFHVSVDYLLGRTDDPQENTINNQNATITDSVQAIKSPVTISGKENKDSNDIMTQFMEAFSDLPFENKVAALNFILEMKKSA